MLPFPIISNTNTIVNYPIKKIEITNRIIVVLYEDGDLYMKGINVNGQFGIGTNTDSATQTPWTLCNTGVDNVWSSENTTVILKGTSLLYAGQSRIIYTNGQKNTWTVLPSTYYANTQIDTVGIKDIKFTYYDLVLLQNDGKLFGSGFNTNGQITGSARSNLVAFTVTSGVNTYTSISTGQVFTGAVGTDGLYYRTGSNTEGQLGAGAVGSYSSLQPLSLPGCTGVSNGYQSSLLSVGNSLYGTGVQRINQILTGNLTENRNLYINVTQSAGTLIGFIPSTFKPWDHNKFLLYSTGLYRTSDSTGIVLVSSDIDSTDMNKFSSSDRANILYVKNNLLYGAGNPRVLLGVDSTVLFYDIRAIQMPPKIN